MGNLAAFQFTLLSGAGAYITAEVLGLDHALVYGMAGMYGGLIIGYAWVAIVNWRHPISGDDHA